MMLSNDEKIKLIKDIIQNHWWDAPSNPVKTWSDHKIVDVILKVINNEVDKI